MLLNFSQQVFLEALPMNCLRHFPTTFSVVFLLNEIFRYGDKCYRKNLEHKKEFWHPGEDEKEKDTSKGKSKTNKDEEEEDE